jgi:hypothetical protein
MSLTCERRSGKDRRQRELGLLGRIERRRGVEARKTEIVDVVLSETEWELHFGNGSVRTNNSVTTRFWGQAPVPAVTRNFKPRSGVDRRQEDLGLPLKMEQRKRVEPRIPEVFETELTTSEWAKHFGDLYDSEDEYAMNLLLISTSLRVRR